jgi:AraC-like DNA-binding protein
MTSASPDREQVEVWRAPERVAPVFLCALRRRVQAGPAPVASRVHANAWACLNVVVSGQVHCADGALPAAFLTGPFSAPFDTEVRGELLSLSIVLQPWALGPLFGVTAAQLADRLLPTESIASRRLHTLCDVAREACAGGNQPAALWDGLAQAAADADAAAPDIALERLREAGVEAAANALGVSARHYRRLFRHHMGLAPASWLRITRWEQSLSDLAAAGSLADLSARHGFADQAHLSRETRALLGTSPGELRHALRAGVGHWSLQPARVRFVQDPQAPGA